MGKISAQYKQNRPTRRVIAGEDTYEKGMYFSDQVLDPGYVRTLFNLEVDQLSFTVKVTGGLHTTDITAGCNFFDRAVFGTDSNQVVVLQGRNEYCARAFEGITNIISVQKLAVKSNQTLAEQIRQQGFTANDVVCYKILTYNPINYRLMSVTMIQASRDKYFVVSPDYSLRRLQVNPISCGMSQVWNTADGTGIYISNRMDFHPNGAEDSYIPRVRRNPFNETYGQVLHSPHYMQTVANCEGFGNKTFLFTNKKQIEITGQIVNQTVVERANIYIPTNIDLGFGDIQVNDIITIWPDRDLEAYEHKLIIQITSIVANTFDFNILSVGRFAWNGIDVDTSWKHSATRAGALVTITMPRFVVLRAAITSIILSETAPTRNTQYDTYLRNCTTGTDTALQASLNGVPISVDSYRFGIVLTSIGFLVDEAAELSTPDMIDDNEQYTSALLGPIKTAGTTNIDKDIPSLEVNLNNGLIRALNGSYSFRALPKLRGDGDVNNPVDEDTGLFKPDVISDTNWFHPAKYIDSSILAMLRVGQGFRFAVFAVSAVSLTRSINTLRGDPLKTEYYDEHPTAVWVMDYVWNGTEWEFSFIDTRYPPTSEFPTLVENWESTPNTLDSLGNRITRHYVWINCLSYTDVITRENQETMATHIVDTEFAARQVYDKTTNTLIGSSNSGLLTYNIDETLDDRLTGAEEFDNKSKLFDTAYGHFEAKPRELRPSEAALWGYNMLSPTPYLFKCEDSPGFEPMITGIVLMRGTLDDATVAGGVPLLKPLINTPGTLFVYFNTDKVLVDTMQPPKYQLKIEYKNIYDEWRTLKTYSVEQTHEILGSLVPFRIPFTSPDETVLIRTEILDTKQTMEVANETGTEMINKFLVTSTIITTLNYTKDPTQIEISPKVFDLGSALGITYWKSRLVAWGVLGAENMLFLSEAGQPEYWPYPNNIDLFEENIVHVVPYSDALIIFTSTKLWRIDLQADGLSWKKTLLQQNLRIIDADIPYICILKNMLFFKSDKQFYMLVPSRGSTVGDVTIAPISKPVSEFLKSPFKALKTLIPEPYKKLANCNRPIDEYLVKYSTHIEQMKIFVNWWFDLTSFKEQTPHISDNVVEQEVLKTSDTDDNPTLMKKEYWLVQLIYDAQTYSWAMRTHTTSKLGTFISDAANADTDFVTLIFSPELTRPDGTAVFTDEQGYSYSKATWGLEVAHRRTPEEKMLRQFTLEEEQVQALAPTYPRYQIFDTGYKEVSNPTLNKRFREVQMFLEPEASGEVHFTAPTDYLQQLIDNDVPKVSEAPGLIDDYMSSSPVGPVTGDAVALKVLLDVYVDGNHVLMSARPEVQYELQADDTLQIKIADVYNFIEGPFTVDAELSNTFMLDNSALAGLKLVRFRRTLNGKGQHIRMRFTNLTETQYTLIGHAFVFHNKNAR